MRYLASYGADAQQESVSFSQALLHATERLKVIAAVHPGQWPPHILAKLAATTQATTNNRLVLTRFLHVREEVDEATTDQLITLTERYCVIAQTLASPPSLEVAGRRG